MTYEVFCANKLEKSFIQKHSQQKETSSETLAEETQMIFSKKKAGKTRTLTVDGMFGIFGLPFLRYKQQIEKKASKKAMIDTLMEEIQLEVSEKYDLECSQKLKLIGIPVFLDLSKYISSLYYQKCSAQKKLTSAIDFLGGI